MKIFNIHEKILYTRIILQFVDITEKFKLYLNIKFHHNLIGCINFYRFDTIFIKKLYSYPLKLVAGAKHKLTYKFTNKQS